MSTVESIIKCPICGSPYVFYPFYAGDQSACPECRNKAKRFDKAQLEAVPGKGCPKLSRGQER